MAKQTRFSVIKDEPGEEVITGDDEFGAFEVNHLSMVLGGETKPYNVHTDPMRHIVNASSPTPRGWYKDKLTTKNVRPRPCYTEALLTTPYGGFCHVGCKFSLLADTQVATPDGYKLIQDFVAGDVVLGRTWVGVGHALVLAPMKHEARGYYRVTLSNGSMLNATADHPVYVLGVGWKALSTCSVGESLESPLRIIGDPVIILDMEWIDEAVEVYDIQTTTENFYAEGVLVHNCYVDHGTRGYRATGLATVNPNYPDEMRKAVGKMLISGAAYISSFTEPFQALEAKYHVTQRLAQVFVDNNLPLFFLSRLDPPDWAVDALLHNPYSYMQWSVNTSNPDQYRRMSPGAIKLDKLWQAMDKLSDQGVYISVQCNPVLPGIVDLEDLINLINIGASVGMKHIIFKFVEQVYNNRKLLIERLAKVPGVDVLDSLLTQTIGGVYTIREDVRREWLGELLKATRKAGITMSTCYEYYADGGAGANLAPWFTTSDQCHGRGVPVHYRTNLGEPFRPLPGCYRKGCLYCAEFGTQACDNPILQEARALQYKDFRTIQLVGDDDNWSMSESCARPEDAWQSVNGNPHQQTDVELWEKYS